MWVWGWMSEHSSISHWVKEEGVPSIHVLCWSSPSPHSSSPPLSSMFDGVVCVHGFTQTAHSYDVIARELCVYGNVYCMDLRGHGQVGTNSRKKIEWLFSSFLFASFTSSLTEWLVRRVHTRGKRRGLTTRDFSLRSLQLLTCWFALHSSPPPSFTR